MALKIDAKLEQNLICGFRNNKNFVKFDPNTRKSALDSLLQNLHFHLFLFHYSEGWCKLWRKNHLRFGKWHEEYGKVSPEHLKVSKLDFWWDSKKSISLKFTEELSVLTMKNDAKFEKELTCRFKIGMSNLMNFDLRTWKSQTFSF